MKTESKEHSENMILGRKFNMVRNNVIVFSPKDWQLLQCVQFSAQGTGLTHY